jgi:hypothetical protein
MLINYYHQPLSTYNKKGTFTASHHAKKHFYRNKQLSKYCPVFGQLNGYNIRLTLQIETVGLGYRKNDFIHNN